MKIFEEIIRWGTLYILVGILIIGLFWEENLTISPDVHKIAATVILVGFGFIISRWAATHETNFLVGRPYENPGNKDRE